MGSRGPVSLPPLTSHIPLPCRGRKRKKSLNHKKSVWPVSKEHGGWQYEEERKSSSWVCLFGLSALHQVTWLKIIRHWLCRDKCSAAIDSYPQDLNLPLNPSGFESYLTREAQVLCFTHCQITVNETSSNTTSILNGWPPERSQPLGDWHLCGISPGGRLWNTNCVCVCNVCTHEIVYLSIRYSQTW